MKPRVITGPRESDASKFKSVSNRLVAACVVAYGASGLAWGEDYPASAQPAQTKSSPTASQAQPAFEGASASARQSAGVVNDWLRSHSSSFSAWDFGGQFRARYEHFEHMGGAADFSASRSSSGDLLLLRTLVHAGYNPTPWLRRVRKSNRSPDELR